MMKTSVLVAALLAGAPAQDPAGFTVDREKREVLIPCKIAPRKLPNLPEVYPIEVIATYPAPKGLKAHETVVNIGARPHEVHKALEGVGLKPGKPARGDDAVASGAALEILLEITPKGQTARQRVRVESVLLDRRTGRPLPPLTWHFTGSVMKQPDPAKPDQVFAADASGTLVGIFPVTDELIVQSNLTMREEGLIKLETNKEILPAEGTDALLVLRPASPGAAAAPAAEPPTARAAAEAAVQGVTHRVGLAPAKSPQGDLPAAAASGAAPPAPPRTPPEPPRPAEARPLPAPLPPLPKDLPAGK
jgi:hypothetical protein